MLYSLILTFFLACSHSKVQPHYIVRHSEHRTNGDIKEVVVTESHFTPLFSFILPIACSGLVVYDAYDTEILNDSTQRLGAITGCLLLGYGIDSFLLRDLQTKDYIYKCPKLSPNHKSYSEPSHPLLITRTNVSGYLKNLDCSLIGNNPAYLSLPKYDHPKLRPIHRPKPPVEKKEPKPLPVAHKNRVGIHSSITGLSVGNEYSPLDLGVYFKKDFLRSYVHVAIGTEFYSDAFPVLQLSYGKYFHADKNTRFGKNAALFYSWKLDLYPSVESDNFAFGGGLSINRRTLNVSEIGLDVELQLGLAYSTYSSGFMFPISLLAGASF